MRLIFFFRTKTANKSEAASKNNKEKAILEVTAGVREYFNVMLPNQLLYRQERAQYEEVRRRGKAEGWLQFQHWGAVLRSQSRWSRNYLRSGAGAEIILLINIY